VIDTARCERIYELAEPYWPTLSNEIHAPGAYALARELAGRELAASRAALAAQSIR
jgi:hypothetical protein